MKRLIWKIFFPVLIAMASMVVISIILVIVLTNRANQDTKHNVPLLYEEAKDVLLDGNKQDLIQWLAENTESLKGARIFILDQNDKDILQRPRPPRRLLIQGFKQRTRSRLDSKARPNSNVMHRARRTGRYPFFISTTGERYRFVLARQQGGPFGLLKSQSIIWRVLLVMIFISAVVSALIARTISQPVKRLRLGAQRFAGGHLTERVSPEFKRRKDEIGELARDFDVMAERISGLMGAQEKLLRDVSHELRSPLARLQVALGLAEQRSGETIKPELTRIETEANVLNEMIGKILSLVRLNNLSIDNSSLKWEKLDLVQMLNTLVSNANYEGQEKNVTVSLQTPNALMIKAVPHLLLSAIENILRNALKHTPENSQVSCQLQQDEEKVMISISDQGTGVSEAELEKIFEPFYRVSSAREHSQGTGGIGLAIAKRAIELHGGTVQAVNLGVGLKVEISL